MHQRVLIVGGGPVGLVLGCELLRQGVEVRLVDADRRPSQHSRSNVIWSRSLELLDRVGVVDALLDGGHQCDGLAYYSYGRHLGSTLVRRLDNLLYPFALMIPQSDTETVLRGRLEELGGQIERGVRLTGLDTSGGRPEAKLEHADGTVEETTADWLIGADGAHSTVRKELAIDYQGPQVNVSIAITDAVMDTALDERLAHHCYSRTGALVLAPLGGARYRIAVSVPHTEDATPPSRALFQELVDDRAPGTNTVGSLNWSTVHRIRCATAATFRHGRCFLVGDAAHIVSPAAGQGMNTGIQDAVNLGWKLGGVLRGTLDARVLDSYDAERRPVVHQVARAAALQTRFGVVGSRYKIAVRDTAVRAAHRTGLLQRYVAPQLSQADVHYGERPRRRLPLPGRPDPAPEGARLPLRLGGAPGAVPGAGHWPAIAADTFTVLLWPGRAAGNPRWGTAKDRARASLPEGVASLDVPASAPRALAAALGTAPAAVLVRPDGHVLARVGMGDPGAVGQAVGRAMREL
ncbi:FAD-dependent monooxygenase [Streptomyces sp. NPDC050560]|uniref:FAD-dependent monooxygenase n=1 Tax=Streptomyces sp. NPDC050560 TaxID=3365630 RepID=UPI0037AB7B4D